MKMFLVDFRHSVIIETLSTESQLVFQCKTCLISWLFFICYCYRCSNTSSSMWICVVAVYFVLYWIYTGITLKLAFVLTRVATNCLIFSIFQLVFSHLMFSVCFVPSRCPVHFSLLPPGGSPRLPPDNWERQLCSATSSTHWFREACPSQCWPVRELQGPATLHFWLLHITAGLQHLLLGYVRKIGRLWGEAF